MQRYGIGAQNIQIDIIFGGGKSEIIRKFEVI